MIDDCEKIINNDYDICEDYELLENNVNPSVEFIGIMNKGKE